MDSDNKLREIGRQKEHFRIVIVGILLVSACVLTYYCHVVLKIHIIFTHFFYIPIIISALWWKRKGIGVAIFLASLLLLSNFLWGVRELLINDWFRAIFFVVIAFVIAMLSEHIERGKEKLCKSEEFNRRMIQSSYDCIKVLDLEGCLLSMSRGGQKLMEIEDIGPYLNKSWIDFWKGADREAALAAIRNAKRGKSGVFQGYCETVKCRPKWWEVIITPIYDANGKIERLLSISRDITERKKAEEILRRDKETFEKLVKERTEELLKTQKELDKAKRLSDLGTLAAAVAHELRNPLGVIRTAVYNIQKKRQSPSLDRHLTHIEKKTLESNQIIDNLLSYSRIKMPQYEKIHIYNFLDECIESTSNRFGKSKVFIDKKFKSIKNTVIEADPLQLREIFDNILNNAYQSIARKKGRIEINARVDSKGMVRIGFKDNGIGIEREDLEKVFEPFFTRKSKGTGLGLTICNELVNLHGGKIDIDSEKGKGTTVTVTFPIRREK